MTALFSYVVEHDYGIAPNPFGGFCTLVKCKFSKNSRKNILELAKEGDWIVGTGGANKIRSAGHGKIIYAMRIDEKLPVDVYFQDKRFNGRLDNDISTKNNRYALISQHFFYFGRNAIDISLVPKDHLLHSLEKKGPGFRNRFSQEFIVDFTKWLEKNYTVGIHGPPCKTRNNNLIQI